MSEAWKETTIGQCLNASFSGEWGTESKPANTLVFRATDIDDEGRIVGSGAERRLPIGKLTAKRLQDGDILLEGSGGGPDKPVGRVAYFDGATCQGSAVCSNFFKTLRPNRTEVDPRFLLRKLAWFYKQPTLLTLQQQTTGIINLKFEEYLSAPIEIPKTIYEQQKLAQILDTLDTAIHETEAITAKLKAVKQGLLHDLLTRGIAANGELRPPQAEAPHLYKKSPLGWVPKGWEAATLSACSLKIADRDHTTPRYIEDGVLIVSPTNLQGDEGIDFVSSKRISRKAHEINCKKTDLAPGDIILHRIGAGLGRVRLVTADMPEFSILHSMAQIRPNLNEMTSHFMLWAMRLDSTKNQMGLGTQSIGVPDLGLDKISNFIVPKPPLEEQRQIASRLVALQTRIDADSNDCAKLPVFDFPQADGMRLWVLPFCFKNRQLILPTSSHLQTFFREAEIPAAS